MNKEDKDKYWNCVKECFVQFCGWSRQKAAANVRVMRPVLDPYKRKLSIIYHREPIHIAENRCDKRFGVATYQEYVKLRDEYFN